MKPVVCQDVQKDYDGFKALRGIDLEIDAGEIVGLLGPNGAGKTTLMHIMAALLAPSSGSVFIDGMNVLERPLNVKRVIGFLPENPPLYERLTGREFLHLLGQLHGMDTSQIEKKIEFYSELLDFTDKLDVFTGAYSKGLLQKVGITGAMMHDPHVLILDEPASGLDPGVVAALKSHIKKWVIRGRRTVVVSTHLTGIASDLCTRIILIKNGKIIGSGTSSKLLRRYGAANLEEVFIKAVGGVNERK